MPSIWTLLLGLGIICLAGWIFYPLVFRILRGIATDNEFDYGSSEFKESIKPSILTFVFLIGFGFAALGIWRLLKLEDSKPAPPNFVAVQQEFTRYQKNKKSFSLDNTWKARRLTLDHGWVDCGFDFSRGDYLWIMSYDQCFVKLQPFDGQSAVLDTVSSAFLQSSVTQKTAVSFKLPLKDPPRYYDDGLNVFIKRWSRANAQKAQLIQIIFCASMFFFAALFLPAGFQLASSKKSSRPEYDSEEETETIEGEPLTEEEKEGFMVKEPRPVNRSSDPENQKAHLNQLLADVVQEIELAHRQPGTMGSIVKKYWPRLQDERVRKVLQSKII